LRAPADDTDDADLDVEDFEDEEAEAPSAASARPGEGNRGRGRPPGSRNKRTKTLQEKLAALKFDPVTSLARIAMNRKNPVDIRLRAAAEAAPYVYAKLRASEVALTGATGGPVRVESDLPPWELARKIAYILAAGAAEAEAARATPLLPPAMPQPADPVSAETPSARPAGRDSRAAPVPPVGREVTAPATQPRPAPVYELFEPLPREDRPSRSAITINSRGPR